jgi:hypothetical protein
MDYGSAGFSSSAGARNVTAAMNPLTPGGLSPKNTHLPTLGWAVLFVVGLFLVYHFVLKGR